MADHDDREQEALSTYRRYLATREMVQAGDEGWEALAAYFTDDAVYIDPAWGRVDGIEAITEFLHDSMAGLDDWEFPEVWTIVEGDRVVSKFLNRIPGADGVWYDVPGISELVYAGDGKFSAETDLLNMAHIQEAMTDSGWVPKGAMNIPPERPRRA